MPEPSPVLSAGASTVAFETPRKQRTQTHTVYRLAPRRGQTVGDRVPSVTQIIATLSNQALVNWANRQGLAGINIRDDYRAREIGTLAHSGIQWWLAGGEKPAADEFDQDCLVPARLAVANWRKWHVEHNVEPLHMEQPLVHQKLEYGGTFDCLARVDGVVTLADWKSSRNPVPYPAHFVQLAAYAELLRVNDYPLPERLLVVAFSREPDNEPAFREQAITEWEPFFRVFTAALEAYRARLEVGF